jgi:hypothetical protein
MRLMEVQAMKALALGALFFSGCGLTMSAMQPDRINLAQYQPGTTRAAISQSLEEHKQTGFTMDGNCETRVLYTSTPDDASRAAQAQWYGIADGLTLGAAELVLTPVAAYQRSQQAPHSVRFCYADNKLSAAPQVIQ